jgi:hypothetical protein
MCVCVCVCARARNSERDGKVIKNDDLGKDVKVNGHDVFAILTCYSPEVTKQSFKNSSHNR